jgi:hypothetical protein
LIAPALFVTAGSLVTGFAATAIIAVVVYKLKQRERGFRAILAREAEQRLHRFHRSSPRHYSSSASAPAA